MCWETISVPSGFVVDLFINLSHLFSREVWPQTLIISIRLKNHKLDALVNKAAPWPWDFCIAVIFRPIRMDKSHMPDLMCHPDSKTPTVKQQSLRVCEPRGPQYKNIIDKQSVILISPSMISIVSETEKLLLIIRGKRFSSSLSKHWENSSPHTISPYLVIS